MSQNLHVLSDQENAGDARRKLIEHNIHHLPVLDKKEELVGIVSAHDLVHLYKQPLNQENPREEQLLCEKKPVTEIMSTELVTMQNHETIEKAIDILAEGHIHSILIIDEEKRLTGIVTNIDLLEYLFN